MSVGHLLGPRERPRLAARLLVQTGHQHVCRLIAAPAVGEILRHTKHTPGVNTQEHALPCLTWCSVPGKCYCYCCSCTATLVVNSCNTRVSFVQQWPALWAPETATATVAVAATKPGLPQHACNNPTGPDLAQRAGRPQPFRPCMT